MGEDMIGYRKDISNEYTGEKINAGSQSDSGSSSKTGSELMQEGKTPDSPTPSVQGSKYGDPNAPAAAVPPSLQHLAAGKLEQNFYGHYLPEHFKKTSIISTKGRVR